MSDVYLGQIMMTGFGFPPRGFAQCNGQLLLINQNTALFALLGTYYGGNGTSNFALPDLRGRTPVGAGQSADSNWNPPPFTLGETVGEETVALGQSQLPAHSHSANASNQAGATRIPTNSIYGAFAGEALYGSASSNLVPLDPTQLQSAGGSQPHDNMQPFRTINFNIALAGVFPSRG